ncbi:MAG TPA: hypothetical protein DCZ43_12295 [candidate division Zixibacteria bacterium]|nr:hypothetical protein [candidate division Zixibacteria bacterium]
MKSGLKNWRADGHCEVSGPFGPETVAIAWLMILIYMRNVFLNQAIATPQHKMLGLAMATDSLAV